MLSDIVIYSTMTIWHTTKPIYEQVFDALSAQILNGVLKPQDEMPSIRSLSVEWQLNPLTIQKAFQKLLDLGCIERVRGKQFTVLPHAQDILLKEIQRDFLTNEWPHIKQKMHTIGLGHLIIKD